MKKVEGLEYQRFFPHGYIFADVLREFIEKGTPFLIIVITKAAGRGGGFNADLYSFKETVPPDVLLFLLKEQLKKEEILICNCRDFKSEQLWSKLLGRNVVLKR